MLELGIIIMNYFNDWCTNFIELMIIWIMYGLYMVCAYRNTLV